MPRFLITRAISDLGYSCVLIYYCFILSHQGRHLDNRFAVEKKSRHRRGTTLGMHRFRSTGPRVLSSFPARHIATLASFLLHEHGALNYVAQNKQK